MSQQAVTTHPRMQNPKTIDVKGIATRYFDQGTGETILFVYGGNFGVGDTGTSAHVWDLNFGPLSHGHRVVALDKLGQGYTANPLRDEDYTMNAVVNHIADFITALGLSRVHIVGHSRGGFAATRVALQFPHLIESLTIVSSGTLSPRIALNEVVLSGQPFPSYTKESARWVYTGYCHDPATVTEEWLDRSYEVQGLPHIKEGVLKMYREGLMTRYWAPGLARDKRETHTWLQEGRLQRPTQIIWGLDDTTVIAEGAYDVFEIVAAHNRHVELTMFNHCGHFAYREHPARFNMQLGSFVAGLTHA